MDFDLSAYDYDLPQGLIAQEPAAERDAARLLFLPRDGGEIRHATIRDLPDLLSPRDVVCVNDTRVVPARLEGRRSTGGRLSALLVREESPGVWRALVLKTARLKSGETLRIGGLEARYLGRDGDEARLDFGTGDVRAAMAREGEVPLPPYIERGPGDPRAVLDRERYQTVFARCDGAVAAPTAGLHLTPALLARLRARGVEVLPLTLTVGPGTFLPIRSEDIRAHRMHAEPYEIPDATVRAVESGRRVVAVGTTVVRTLETFARTGRTRGETDLFITPGFEFRVVRALLTNFHLPRSTLLVLVAAFVGRERILAAYREAVRLGYRFYSYGDAMLIA